MARTFADVAIGNAYYSAVELFWQRGITAGCGMDSATAKPLFCPDNTITRGETSAFAIRSIFSAVNGNGEAFSLNQPYTAYFADVPTSHPFFRYIQKMWELHITSGCYDDGQGYRLFCPDSLLTNSQIAVFATKAQMSKNLGGGDVQGLQPSCYGIPGYCASLNDFWDVPPGNGFHDWIEAVWTQMGSAAKIACSAYGYYCPENGATRGQMAVDLYWMALNQGAGLPGAWQPQYNIPTPVHNSTLQYGSGNSVTFTINSNTWPITMKVGYTGWGASDFGTYTVCPGGGCGSQTTMMLSGLAWHDVQPYLYVSLGTPPGQFGIGRYFRYTTPSQAGVTQTITTSPVGLSVVVDGVSCTSPCPFQWPAGSQHTIAATIAQTGADGTQYLYSSWSDGWPASHTITTPGSATTFVASFARRVPVYGGVSPSQLEVNLGSVPIDLYDETSGNTYLQPCSSAWRAQACMQYFLSNYAIQGVTGVRFQFTTQSWPSTALVGGGTVSDIWAGKLLNFFNDLKAFGINNITPTPSWDDFGASRSGPIDAAYLNAPGCPSGSKSLYFAPLLPYGSDPSNGYNPDGALELGNNAYYCSPRNPNFWGWDKHYALVDRIASVARAAGLNIVEFDIENEVDLNYYPVQARLVYDNVTMTPVFQLLGQALANHYYDSRVLTVSVNTYSSANSCGTVYGDAGQVLPSVELLAATGGAVIGAQPYGYYSADGGMICDGSFANGYCPDPAHYPVEWAACATAGMIHIPTQGQPTAQPTRAVIDMHTKPGAGMSSNTFSAIWDFISSRQLTSSLLMFGETWSNSQRFCNGDPDASLTQQMISSYRQNLPPNPSNVVFRPWGNVQVAQSLCETPLNIGAQSGTFRQ